MEFAGRTFTNSSKATTAEPTLNESTSDTGLAYVLAVGLLITTVIVGASCLIVRSAWLSVKKRENTRTSRGGRQCMGYQYTTNDAYNTSSRVVQDKSSNHKPECATCHLENRSYLAGDLAGEDNPQLNTAPVYETIV